MHLSDFMTARALRDEDAAEQTGLSRATISRIRRKVQRPDWSTIAKLKEWSGGAITADDFQEMPATAEVRA